MSPLFCNFSHLSKLFAPFIRNLGAAGFYPEQACESTEDAFMEKMFGLINSSPIHFWKIHFGQGVEMFITVEMLHDSGQISIHPNPTYITILLVGWQIMVPLSPLLLLSATKPS